MSDSRSINVSGGVGIAGLLFVAFVVLKLCEVIAWSWWWVTAPLWGGIALAVAVLVLIGGVFAGVAAVLFVGGVIVRLFGQCYRRLGRTRNDSLCEAIDRYVKERKE